MPEAKTSTTQQRIPPLMSMSPLSISSTDTSGAPEGVGRNRSKFYGNIEPILGARHPSYAGRLRDWVLGASGGASG